MNTLNTIPLEHAVAKLNKEASNQKIIKFGDETFVCDLTSDEKLTENAKKFIYYRRMKL